MVARSVESTNYIFCSYPFSLLIWDSFCSSLSICSPLDKLLTFCSKWLSSKFPKDMKSTTFMLIVALMCAIWTEKNSKILQNRTSSHLSITHMALQSYNEQSILCESKPVRGFLKFQSSIKVVWNSAASVVFSMEV